MVRFSLFGIPVTIEPWFWVSAALLGGALGATTAESLFKVLLFMLVALVSIMAHEFGHALVGRRLAGGQPTVTLWAFGGLATHHGARFTRPGRMATILAGPGAGLLVFALVVGALCIAFRPAHGLALSSLVLFGTSPLPVGPELPAALARLPDRAWWLLADLLTVNFWWSLINLLPVLPLDGGQLAELVLPRRRALLLSAVTAAAVALAGLLVLRAFFLALLFGYLAWRSYGGLRRPWAG